MATIGYYICFPFAALMRLFYSLTSSYGVSLLLFTLVIKLIMLPFQMKSKKSMMRMNRLNGRVQEIQKKYANNRLRMNEEIQKLYEDEGANPMSGCVWSMLPLPIMMALYYIIRKPIQFFMNFGSLAAGAEVLEKAKEVVSSMGLSWTTLKGGADGAYAQIEILRHISTNTDNAAVQKFLSETPGWVNVDYNFLGIDLTQVPGQHLADLKSGGWAVIGLMLIPVISGLLSLFLANLNKKNQPQPTAETAASSNMMTWMMPLMSLYFGFMLPAALGVYWIAQSAFSYLQEVVLNHFFSSKMEAEEEARQKEVEERRRKRQEEARRMQEEQRQLSARQQAAAKKKAEAARQKNPNKASTTEAGRIGDRPYARGRAFSEDHYRDDETTTK